MNLFVKEIVKHDFVRVIGYNQGVLVTQETQRHFSHKFWKIP